MKPGLHIVPQAFQKALLALILCLSLNGAFAQSATRPSPEPQATPTPTPQAAVTSEPKASPTPQGTSIKSLERQFFKNILRDQRAIWTSPFHIQSEDARWLIPLGLTTATLIATDKHTAGALHDDRLRLNLSRDVGYLGSGFTVGAIAGSLYLLGRARGDDRLRKTGLLSAEALINDAAVVTALKMATQRARPRKDHRGRFFHGGLAFPSGHSMAAWSTATIIASEYKERPLLRIGVYSLATMVSASRFTGRNHFLSDVVVGSALGYGIGRYVHKKHNSSARGENDQGLTSPKRSRFVPLFVPMYQLHSQTYGVSLAWKL